tara:strand:+ start:7947 stop:8792 length:846 start_codon:yes stop_codon:yes gene_type:complete
MSNKNLLNEAQVRQFMKLARLEPLTPGFVEGLKGHTDGDLGEVRTPRPPNDAMEGERGRGHSGGNYRLKEEAPEGELALDAEDDLAGGSPEEDAEAAVDMEKMDAEEGAEGRQVSVDDFLAALESALEEVMGDEVEIDTDDMGDEEEVEMDVDLDDAESMEDDTEMNMELQEEEGSKWKGGEHEYKRREKKGKVGKRAGDVGGHYKTGETDKPKEKSSDEPESEKKWGGNKGDEPREWDPKTKTKRKKTDFAESTEANDELVEAITKRVAARILKSALTKK